MGVITQNGQVVITNGSILTYEGSGGGGGTTAVTFSTSTSGGSYHITYVDADENTVNTDFWTLSGGSPTVTVNATSGTPIAISLLSGMSDAVPTPTNTSVFYSTAGSAGSRPTEYYAFYVFIVG